MLQCLKPIQSVLSKTPVVHSPLCAVLAKLDLLPEQNFQNTLQSDKRNFSLSICYLTAPRN